MTTASGRVGRFVPPDGDVWLIEQDAPSIAVAYNRMIDSATGVVVFVHDDVTLGESTRHRIVEHITDGAGLVGQVGSSGHRGLDWWRGRTAGHVVETRGELEFGPRVRRGVDQIDGFIMALSPTVSETFRFDEDYDGWHGYDADLSAWCVANGHRVDVADLGARHHTRGGFGEGWPDADDRWHQKWG